MVDKQVYVSLNPLEHKQIRSGILESQVSILNILKQLSKLQRIKRKRTLIKEKLIKQYLNLLKKVEDLDLKIPDTSLSKELKMRISQKEIAKEIEESEVFERENYDDESIEGELLSINEQLKAING